MIIFNSASLGYCHIVVTWLVSLLVSLVSLKDRRFSGFSLAFISTAITYSLSLLLFSLVFRNTPWSSIFDLWVTTIALILPSQLLLSHALFTSYDLTSTIYILINPHNVLLSRFSLKTNKCSYLLPREPSCNAALAWPRTTKHMIPPWFYIVTSVRRDPKGGRFFPTVTSLTRRVGVCKTEIAVYLSARFIQRTAHEALPVIKAIGKVVNRYTISVVRITAARFGSVDASDEAIRQDSCGAEAQSEGYHGESHLADA
jgi:hypothetical protein